MPFNLTEIKEQAAKIDTFHFCELNEKRYDPKNHYDNLKRIKKLLTDSVLEEIAENQYDIIKE